MIDHAALSIQGPVRSNNEDYVACEIAQDTEVRVRRGHVFVIADGVGGCEAGEIASREATQTLIRCYYASTKQPDAALREAFHHANYHLFDLGHDSSGGFQSLQTTLTAFVLIGNRIFIGHVGDSRLYRFRPSVGEMQQLTNDHSEVAELMRLGIINAEEARHHPRRHIVTRSVGGNHTVLPQSRFEIVNPEDIFVLCTDGVWEHLEKAEIAQVVAKHTAEDACRRLVDLVLEREPTDNISVQIVKVVKLEEHSGEGMGRPSLFSRMRNLFGFFGSSAGANTTKATSPNTVPETEKKHEA
jgi:protein phosphatase